MRSRWNIAGPLAIVLLIAGCDGGGDGSGGAEAKRAFDAYENLVNPILQEDERLRKEFAEASEVSTTMGADDELRDFVRRTLLPRYDSLLKRSKKARPESGKLRSIHLQLENYLALRITAYQTFLDWAERAVPVASRLNPALLKYQEARKKVHDRTVGIDDLVKQAQAGGDEDLVRSMQELLKGDPVMAMGFFQLVEVCVRGEQGGSVEKLREGIATKVVPYFEKLDTAIRTAEAGAPNAARRDALAAVRAYHTDMQDCLDHLENMVNVLEEIGPSIMKDLQPRYDRYNLLAEQANQDIARYKKVARDYRASL